MTNTIEDTKKYMRKIYYDCVVMVVVSIAVKFIVATRTKFTILYIDVFGMVDHGDFRVYTVRERIY